MCASSFDHGVFDAVSHFSLVHLSPDLLEALPKLFFPAWYVVTLDIKS